MAVMLSIPIFYFHYTVTLSSPKNLRKILTALCFSPSKLQTVVILFSERVSDALILYLFDLIELVGMNLKIVSNLVCYADKVNMEPSCLLGDYRTSICVKYPSYWNSSDSQVSTLTFCECKLTDPRPVSLYEFSPISSTKSTSFLIKVRKITSN